MPQFEPGATFSRERTFTDQDVRRFTEVGKEVLSGNIRGMVRR